MLDRKSYLITVILLLLIPVILSSYKYATYRTTLMDMIPKEVYRVKLVFDITDISEYSYIKTYLPESDHRQKIRNISWSGDSLCIDYSKDVSGITGRWEASDQKDLLYTYSYEVEGKEVKYEIPADSPYELQIEPSLASYLASEPFIQVADPKIDSLAQALKQSTVLTTLQANFDFVKKIETSNTRVLTDALSAMELNRASCNGKSRLFTAICRAQGIPARVVGGTILENATKRTSHLWAEIHYGDAWIPFDVLNEHFAALPANYLELYNGDQFLFRHTNNLNFDYQFVIEKKYTSLSGDKIRGPQLWSLLSELHISMNLLRTILLLPIAALLIAIFRNVIGIKTFGILLPALIGLALVNVNLKTGLIAFALVIVIVTLVHKLLEQWSLLHVPKVTIILTCVILTLLGLSSVGIELDWELGEMMIFLPIVIISITAERFAKVLIEENISDAIKMLCYTFGVALLTCLIFKSKLLLGILLTYPEQYLTILLVTLLLGRWIGMRIMEYHRFAPSIKPDQLIT